MNRVFAAATLLLIGLLTPVLAQSYQTDFPFAFDTNGLPRGMNGGRLPSTIFVSTGSQTNPSTSDQSCFSPTNFVGTQTLPANGVYVGNRYRVLCRGTYSVPLVNTAIVTMRVKWGATTVATASATPVPTAANNYPFWIDVTCTIRGVGGSGSIVCLGTLQFSTVLTALAPIVAPLVTPSPVTIDTTVASKLDLTASWSSTAGGQTATGLDGSIEILN